MLRQIRYFISVVKNNSFSEAAEECHISQSAVSQQIKLLEEELSVKLFDRKNRKFTLTPAGEYFYKKDEFNGIRGDFYKNMFKQCPAGRPGTADEVANVAELLMSSKGAFITGSDFLMDGGATASYYYGPLRG